MADTNAICQKAAPTTHKTVIAATNEPYKKAHLLMTNIGDFSGKQEIRKIGH